MRNSQGRWRRLWTPCPLHAHRSSYRCKQGLAMGASAFLPLWPAGTDSNCNSVSRVRDTGSEKSCRWPPASLPLPRWWQ